MEEPTDISAPAEEVVHVVHPEDTYQIDSSEYSDSDAESDDQDDDWAALMDTWAYPEEKQRAWIAKLKEIGVVNFLRTYLYSPEIAGRPHAAKELLLGFRIVPPAPLRHPLVPDSELLNFAKVALARILRRRNKLPQYNSVDDAVDLLRNAKNVMVLSGAGISTSCGIPDFRSASGLYANLQAEGKYDLDDPQQMFDIRYFVENPEVFYSFAKQIYPSNFTPSPCHRWIKLLEDRGVLLRNYTQNIDTLESLAGVTRVLQCHGSFKTASCLRCKERVPGQAIESYIMSQTIPYCGPCRQKRDAELEAIRKYKEAKERAKGKGKARATFDDTDSDEDVDEWGGGLPGIIKPDITFFGQPLDDEFDRCLFDDREKVDLLVIIGTSLKVAPVSEVLTHIPHSVPQIFINLTPVLHVTPDICLLGDADSIVSYLCQRLGWEIPPPTAVALSPPSEDKKDMKNDILYQTDRSKMAPDLLIPPEHAKWYTLNGLQWPNTHVLTDKTASEPYSDTDRSDTAARRLLLAGWPSDEEEEDDEEDEEDEKEALASLVDEDGGVVVREQSSPEVTTSEEPPSGEEPLGLRDVGGEAEGVSSDDEPNHKLDGEGADGEDAGEEDEADGEADGQLAEQDRPSKRTRVEEVPV